MPATGVNAPRTRTLVDLDVIGSRPVDGASPVNLEVTVDPAVTAPGFADATCEGELGALARMCSSPVYQAWPPLHRDHDTFALEVTPSLVGPTLLVEVLDDDGALRGRVFPGFRNDGEGPVPATCGGDWAGELTGGTLRIDRLAPDAHGELVVHAAEGGTITVRF